MQSIEQQQSTQLSNHFLQTVAYHSTKHTIPKLKLAKIIPLQIDVCSMSKKEVKLLANCAK